MVVVVIIRWRRRRNEGRSRGSGGHHEPRRLRGELLRVCAVYAAAACEIMSIAAVITRSPWCREEALPRTYARTTGHRRRGCAQGLLLVLVLHRRRWLG